MSPQLDPMTEQKSSPHVLDLPTAGGRVIRGSVYRVSAYAGGMLIGVLGAALMTRHLGAADFGRYVTVTSVVAVAAGLTEAGLLNIGVREYSIREGAPRDLFLRNLLGVRLVVTCAGTLLAIAFSVVAGYASEMIVGTFLVGVGLIFTTLQQTVGIPLSAELRLGWLSVLDLLRQLATVIGIAVLVLTGAGLLPFFAIQIPVAIGVLGLTVLLVRGRGSLWPALTRAEWVRMKDAVLPYAAANSVGVLYGYLAIIILSLVSTAQETGYFGAAFRVYLVLAGVPALLVGSAFPILARAARDDHTRLAYANQRLWDISLIVGSGIALATFVGAPLAIDLIAGSQFSASVDTLRVLAVQLIPSFIMGVWGIVLLALARFRGILAANAVALLANAFTALALTPSHGALGASLATLAGDICLAVSYGIVLMRRNPEFRVSLELVPRVALACGLAICALLLPSSTLVRLIAATATYLAALVILRAVPREISEALLQHWRRPAA